MNAARPLGTLSTTSQKMVNECSSMVMALIMISMAIEANVKKLTSKTRIAWAKAKLIEITLRDASILKVNTGWVEVKASNNIIIKFFAVVVVVPKGLFTKFEGSKPIKVAKVRILAPQAAPRSDFVKVNKMS